VKGLTTAESAELVQLLEEDARRKALNRFANTFPDTGPHRRELYQKHIEFFALGATYNERALFGGNRSGKTVAGCYEDTAHLTGLYPKWWRGKRFDEPVDMWVAGDTSKTVRDILQATLLGKPGDASAQGTGMIPGALILRTTPKHGLADAIETAFVRHASGGTSTVQFKSYDQGRDAFQGTSQHVIHPDEACTQEIYAECLMRLLTTGGIIYWTATLVEGITPLMLDFMPHMRPTPE
jgi:phage terminase large subunit-like protein